MADAAIELLADPDRLAQFGARAQSRARERFGSETIVPQYEALYQSLLE